jgi:hypothetical protein
LDGQQTDVRLLRPAVDPTIPWASRELLLAAGETAVALRRPGLLPLSTS